MNTNNSADYCGERTASTTNVRRIQRHLAANMKKEKTENLKDNLPNPLDLADPLSFEIVFDLVDLVTQPMLGFSSNFSLLTAAYCRRVTYALGGRY